MNIPTKVKIKTGNIEDNRYVMNLVYPNGHKAKVKFLNAGILFIHPHGKNDVHMTYTDNSQEYFDHHPFRAITIAELKYSSTKLYKTLNP